MSTAGMENKKLNSEVPCHYFSLAVFLHKIIKMVHHWEMGTLLLEQNIVIIKGISIVLEVNNQFARCLQ